MYKILSKGTLDYFANKGLVVNNDQISEEDLRKVLLENGTSNLEKHIADLLRDKVIEIYGQTQNSVLPKNQHGIVKDIETDGE